MGVEKATPKKKKRANRRNKKKKRKKKKRKRRGGGRGARRGQGLRTAQSSGHSASWWAVLLLTMLFVMEIGLTSWSFTPFLYWLASGSVTACSGTSFFRSSFGWPAGQRTTKWSARRPGAPHEEAVLRAARKRLKVWSASGPGAAHEGAVLSDAWKHFGYHQNTKGGQEARVWQLPFRFSWVWQWPAEILLWGTEPMQNIGFQKVLEK